MGKGGYGKAWSRRQPWQQNHRTWSGKGGWQKWDGHDHGHHSNHYSEAHQSSLNQLCAGVVSSAWDGVCSGVASAAWKAVEGTAGLFMKSCQNDKQAVKQTAQGMMACLAGKAEEPQNAVDMPAEEPSDQKGEQKLVLSILELQKEQMQQQSLLQKQLFDMCNAEAEKPPSAPKSARQKATTNGSNSRNSSGGKSKAATSSPSASAPSEKPTRRRVRGGASAAKKPTRKTGRAAAKPKASKTACKTKGKTTE
jgi:hypothetical protein